MSSWVKVPHKYSSLFTLEVREGVRTVSYRYRFRREGMEIEGVIDGLNEDGSKREVKEISRLADQFIAKKRAGDKPKAKSLIRSEDLCDEIVKLKESKDPSTYEQAEIFFRVHIKPFLNQHCPYASELNSTVWLNYKNLFRLGHPKSPLFNHWKYFGQLCKYAFEKGIIPQKIKLEYSERQEDNRARGLIIPDEDFKKMIAAANRVWRDRMIIQRLTGQRPGVIRDLRKDQVDFQTGVISVQKLDSKNRRNYSFVAPPAVLNLLSARMANGSPYFFPSEKDKSKPMDKHLAGWRGALKRAFDPEGKGLPIPKYTPHDARHSRLTELFKTAGINHALVCYQCDLSLEEAMKTYIHFGASDTAPIAQDAAARAKDLLGGAS